MSLNDPMFFLELAGRCLRAGARSESPLATLGMRKLAQGYLDIAESVLPQKQAEAIAPDQPVAEAA